MANYTTIFGEAVELRTVQLVKSSYKFVVEKRINGQLRSSYPCKSIGQVNLLINKAIA